MRLIISAGILMVEVYSNGDGPSMVRLWSVYGPSLVRLWSVYGPSMVRLRFAGQFPPRDKGVLCPCKKASRMAAPGSGGG